MSSSSSKIEKNSPRLIDYICFVGKRKPNRNGRAISQPELLRVYPPQNHADFALPNDIVYFCQPDGCYSTSSRSFILDPRHSGGRLPQNIKMEFFTFMLTDKESNIVRFGICLNFLRPIGRRKLSYTSKITRRRIKSFKTAVSKMSKERSPARMHSCDTPLDSNSSSDSSDFIENQSPDKPDRPNTHTLTSICIVSRYQFFKKFEKCLQFLYALIQKLHEGCKPRISGRQTVWSVLTGAIENPELLTVRKSVEEIDTWVLRLLSTPAPLAGKTAVHAYLQPPELGPPIIFALPDAKRFSLVDYSLCLPLRLLGVEKFLKVFFAMLLEQKVVLESTHHDRLTTCVLAFTSLCYPLQYLFTVIPLLPSSLRGAEQLLHAPSPYIVGLPRSFRDSRPSFQLPKDVLLVDLDTQEFYGQGAQEPMPKLPQPEEKRLLLQLNRVLAGLNGTKEEPGEKREKKNSSSSSDSSSFDQLAHNMDEESLNLAIRVAMVLFFKSPNVLGGFTEHTRTVRIYPRPVVAFQYERFMKSRPEPSPFTVVLAKTQAVEYFAEWSLMPDNTVYQYVHSDDLRPSELGDRDKWFSESLAPIPFHLWTERFDRGLLRPVVELLFCSVSFQHFGNTNHDFSPGWTSGKQLTFKASPSATQSSTSGACEIETFSESDTPTDVSASNGDSQAERILDVESGEEGAHSDTRRNGGVEKSDVHLSSLALGSSPSHVEIMQFGSELPSNLRNYYTPPSKFVIPEAQSQRNLTSASVSPQESLSTGQMIKEITQRLAASSNFTTSVGPSAQTFDSPDSLRTPGSNQSTRRASEVNSPNGSRTQLSQSSQSSQSKSTKSTLSAIIDSWFLDAGKSTEDSDPQARKRRVELQLSENQRFINDCVTSIRKGNQPGVFSRRRLQKLLEEEMYRNLTLALTNGNVGHPVPPDQCHISDVFLDSWDQYKAYVWLFNQLGVGIRQSCRPLMSTFIDSRGDIVSAVGLASAFRDLFTSQAEKERVARGGVCSAFSLLEMAHTHRHLLPKRRSNINSSTVLSPITTSKLSGLGTSAASVPTSPKQKITVTISPKIEPRTNGKSSTSDENLVADSESMFNVINTQNLTAPHILSPAEQKPHTEEEASNITNSNGISMDMVEDVVLLPPFKSAVSLGYRYRYGRLFQMTPHVSHTVGTPPPCISVPSLRINLAEQRASKTTRRPSTSSNPDNQQDVSDETSETTTLEENEVQNLKPDQLRSKIGQTYLFEEAMVNAMESKLWTNMQFWEDLFLDTVAQERDLMGMGFDPTGLLEHYSQLGAITKKKLELSEDSLLAGVMHNLIAFMVMARIPPDLIRRKIRRLIAKSHTGLHFTQKITHLLDCLEWLRGNDIDLLPIASRQNAPESFSVCLDWEEYAEMRIMEVHVDFVLIRTMEGGALCRWWYDEIINIMGSPQQNVIIFHVRLNGQRFRFMVTAVDSNALFTSIAKAIKNAKSKNPHGQILDSLGGKVNVVDAETGESGEIVLDSNGFNITFGSNSRLISHEKVKACRVSAEEIFSIEFNIQDRVSVTWNFKTDVAAVLLNQWERLINVNEAMNLMNTFSGITTPMSSRSRSSSTNNINSVFL